MTPEQAVYLYTLLVRHAGALESERADFLLYFTPERLTGEWRFRGSLGFGGKVYLERGRARVGYDPRDRTAEREAARQKVNELIREGFGG